MSSGDKPPGDPEGGMFGLRSVFEQGPPPQPPADHSKLIAAMLGARLGESGLAKRRRGAPPKPWRTDLKPVALTVWQHFPNATNVEIATAIRKLARRPECKDIAGGASQRTIEIWLGEVRRENAR